MKLRSIIAALNAALFAIALVATPAGAGSMALLGAGKATVAASTTTLNPSDKGSGGTLSNGNLTWTANTSTQSLVRSTTSHGSGKFYFESKFDAIGAGYGPGVGFANASSLLDVNITGSVDRMGMYGNSGDGNWYYNGGPLFTVTTIPQVDGNVVGVAVDLTTQRLWVRIDAGNWNNDALANPATGTNGIDISSFASLGAVYVFAWVNNAVGAVASTVNFGATSYANAAPSGFGNW